MERQSRDHHQPYGSYGTHRLTPLTRLSAGPAVPKPFTGGLYGPTHAPQDEAGRGRAGEQRSRFAAQGLHGPAGGSGDPDPYQQRKGSRVPSGRRGVREVGRPPPDITAYLAWWSGQPAVMIVEILPRVVEGKIRGHYERVEVAR
jgi:hypothetical protein